MRLRWTPAAADALETIADYLAQKIPSFEHATIRQIYEAIATLKSMPNRGRAGSEAGTRELVISRLPYIVVHRVRSDAVEILHIYHGAREKH